MCHPGKLHSFCALFDTIIFIVCACTDRDVCYVLFITCNCVACIAWQTHRDHVVRPHRWHHRRCHRHTFPFHSITFEEMYGFHSNFAELYITIKYRSSSLLVIIRQIWAELWPFFDLVFVVRFLSVTFEGMY